MGDFAKLVEDAEMAPGGRYTRKHRNAFDSTGLANRACFDNLPYGIRGLSDVFGRNIWHGPLTFRYIGLSCVRWGEFYTRILLRISRRSGTPFLAFRAFLACGFVRRRRSDHLGAFRFHKTRKYAHLRRNVFKVIQ